MVRKLPVLIAVMAALAFGLAACGDDNSDTSSTAASSDTTSSTESSTTEETTASGGGGGGESVDISETEFKLDPSDATVKSGTVTFNVSNDGSQVHNLEIEGEGVEEETEDLDAGQSGQLSVELQPGTYEMYCAIDGHRDLGMEGEITVE